MKSFVIQQNYSTYQILFWMVWTHPPACR